MRASGEEGVRGQGSAKGSGFRVQGPGPTTGNGQLATGNSPSQWALIRRRFARHRLAVWSLYVLGILYLLAAFCEFFAPYSPGRRDLRYAYCPPQPPRLGLTGFYFRPLTQHTDPITYRKSYVVAEGPAMPLRFFAPGEPYRLWGLIPCQRHFLVPASGEVPFHLLGADRYGRDLLSRIIYGARVSLSIGLVSIVVTFLLGVSIGGISGYVGGALDNFIQRLIEIVNSFPHLPLWLALGAVMPAEWPPLQVYFGITVVLALLSWTGLARVVRGKLLSLREEDYAVAARLLGAGHGRVLFRHLLPGFTSHIIVTLTLSVPAMILGETSLSFLGLGLRPPVVSWGVMLQDCMNMQDVGNYPWMLLPTAFIVLTVLSFNFLGDGLRDAADPYSGR